MTLAIALSTHRTQTLPGPERPSVLYRWRQGLHAHARASGALDPRMKSPPHPLIPSDEAEIASPVFNEDNDNV